MKAYVVWLIHFPTGTVALLAAIAALYYVKGSSRHIRAGRIFIVSMLIMLFSGGVAGWIKKSPDDVLMAAMIIYTVFTAWLTVHRRAGETGIMEYLALTYLLGWLFVTLAIDTTWELVRDPNFYVIMPLFAALFAAGDVYNLLLGGLTGAQRLARHIWRVCFSLIWAAMAFGDKIIKLMHSSIEEMPHVLYGPALFVLCLMFYWLYRVYRGSGSAAAEP
jgi:hypothetical protein